MTSWRNCSRVQRRWEDGVGWFLQQIDKHNPSKTHNPKGLQKPWKQIQIATGFNRIQPMGLATLTQRTPSAYRKWTLSCQKLTASQWTKVQKLQMSIRCEDHVVKLARWEQACSCDCKPLVIQWTMLNVRDRNTRLFDQTWDSKYKASLLSRNGDSCSFSCLTYQC